MNKFTKIFLFSKDLFIYFLHTCMLYLFSFYTHVCFQRIVFARKHLWHKPCKWGTQLDLNSLVFE